MPATGRIPALVNSHFIERTNFDWRHWSVRPDGLFMHDLLVAYWRSDNPRACFIYNSPAAGAANPKTWRTSQREQINYLITQLAAAGKFPPDSRIPRVWHRKMSTGNYQMQIGVIGFESLPIPINSDFRLL